MNSRRIFIKQSGLYLMTTAILPSFLPRIALSADRLHPNKKFVYIFLRGAMDGLSMLIPEGDSQYLSGRPNIGIKKNVDKNPIPLDSFFSIHPAMESIKPLWDEGSLAFIPQSGSPSSTRSHFDAQDFIEGGTLDDKNIHEGFLNRTLTLLDPSKQAILKGVALQPSMPRCLQGSFPAVSMNSLNEFQIKGPTTKSTSNMDFAQMYEQAADKVFRGVGDEIFDSLKNVKQAQDLGKDNAQKNYPKHPLAKRLADIASLIKAGTGLQIAVTDMGGWDTHVNQGNFKGQLSDRFKELTESLAAFVKDLGPHYKDTCIVVMTEFGRTMKENGTNGTDHGHGSVMMVLGGSVKGKKVLGRWKDLKPENLFEGRDVPVVTDYRHVLSEVLIKHLGIKSTETIFPKFASNKTNWLGFV